ncbi:MAG TPA: hypothetical protein VIF08_02210 [Candidatus Limnocylindrales bacterium]
MRITSAGLKSGHPTTRFSRSPSTRRERQLGLRISTRPHMTAHPGSHARVPLLTSLRQAARSASNVEPATSAPAASAPARITPSVSFTWTRPAGTGSRRPRPRSAAPWRG